jgi:membrane protein involved in colicin uptake
MPAAMSQVVELHDGTATSVWYRFFFSLWAKVLENSKVNEDSLQAAIDTANNAQNTANQTQTDLASEVSRAEAAEAAEKSRAEAAEAALQALINTPDNAQTVDLQTQINDILTKLAAGGFPPQSGPPGSGGPG